LRSSSPPPYLTLNPAISKIPLNASVALHFPILVIHVITGGSALLIGPFQFVSHLRTKHPMLHQKLGRMYLICVLVAGLAAFFSALVSTSGLAERQGCSRSHLALQRIQSI
jgi:uncharacterized membrane protein